MKIDAVLARHPWPWTLTQHKADRSLWTVRGSHGQPVVWHHSIPIDIRDAILELVEAHVAEMERVAKRSLSGVPKEQVLKGLGALADALNAGKAQGEASEEVKK